MREDPLGQIKHEARVGAEARREHGDGEEAEGPARVRDSPRNGAGVDPHRALPGHTRSALPRLAKVNAYFLQGMKTNWGSCNHREGNIRLREARAEINELPLTAESWNE